MSENEFNPNPSPPPKPRSEIVSENITRFKFSHIHYGVCVGGGINRKDANFIEDWRRRPIGNLIWLDERFHQFYFNLSDLATAANLIGREI